MKINAATRYLVSVIFIVLAVFSNSDTMVSFLLLSIHPEFKKTPMRPKHTDILTGFFHNDESESKTLKSVQCYREESATQIRDPQNKKYKKYRKNYRN